MQNASIAAFFDFDKTLLATESSRIGIRYLRQLGMISTPYLLKVVVANFFYNVRLISDEALADVLLTVYRGRRLAEFQEGAADFYTIHLKPHLAPLLLERLNWHRHRRHTVVLISGSLRYMLEPVVEDLGIAYLLCSDLEEDRDGRLTGKLNGRLCMGDHKRYLARRLAREKGLDLKNSYAYGDHHSDLPILSLVGFPHAVEPDRPLRRAARKHQWPILSHR
jgi:HAD superfamily hydrolase (TIGR01490 family)